MINFKEEKKKTLRKDKKWNWSLNKKDITTIIMGLFSISLNIFTISRLFYKNYLISKDPLILIVIFFIVILTLSIVFSFLVFIDVLISRKLLYQRMMIIEDITRIVNKK